MDKPVSDFTETKIKSIGYNLNFLIKLFRSAFPPPSLLLYFPNLKGLPLRMLKAWLPVDGFGSLVDHEGSNVIIGLSP